MSKILSEGQKVREEISKRRTEQLATELSPIPADTLVGEPEPFEPDPNLAAPKAEERPRNQDGRFAAPPVDDAPPPPADEPAPSPAPAEDPPADEPAAPKMVTVKIDGVEEQVSQEAIDKAGSVALLQIERAAEKRLKELNDKKAELNEALNKVRQQLNPPAPPPNKDEAYRAQLQTLRFGNDEEAIAVLKGLDRPATNPTETATMAALAVEWKGAARAFVKDMGPLWQDPDIQTIAYVREQRFKQETIGQGRLPDDLTKFYTDLGAELKGKFGKPAAPVDLEKRREAKERLANPPTASGRIPPPAVVKDKTNAEKIADQRKARGQITH